MQCKMKLKQYTLSSPLTIYEGPKKIATIYDAISALIFCKYFVSSKLILKAGSKKIDNYNQLRVVYGDLTPLVDVARKFITNDFFVEAKWSNSYVIFPENNYLEFLWNCLNNIADFVWDILAEYVETQDQLNHELEEILQYWLFDDEWFSKLANYYTGLIFNETLESWQKATVKFGDNLLATTLDDADKIPDWVIDYVEQKVLWYDFDTANLRKVIGFEPHWRQRYFLVNQRRFSSIVWCRKLWKSFLLAYLLIRQMFKKNQDIIYVVPNFDQADQIWSYVERFIRDINDPWLRFDKARRTFSYTTNRSICTFVSGDSKSMGRSKKADAVFYDEASFVSDIARKTMIPLTANTKGMEVYASTVSIETPINRFYKNFKRWELWLDVAYFSVRIDIYHNPFIEDDEKQRLINEYKDDPLMSATELFAMFPSVWWWFNLGEFFLHHTNTTDIIINGIKFVMKWEIEELKKEYYRFALGYDPALMRDKWWLLVTWIKKIKDTQDWVPVDKNKFEIIWWAYINITDYTQQINVILELQAALEMNIWSVRYPCFVAMDATWSGMWVYELMRWMGVEEIHRIFRWWSNFIEPTYDNGIWKANKKDLESIFRAWAGRDLFAYNYLTELRGEIEEYWVSTRSMGDGHFDQLSAGFCSYFICKRYIGDWIWDSRNLPWNPNDLYDHLQDIYDKRMNTPWSLNYEEWAIVPNKPKNERFRRFVF